MNGVLTASLDWYSEMVADDLDAHKTAERLWGPEKEVFSSAMMTTQAVLEAALGDGMSGDVPGIKMSIASHAFNVLWSAWRDVSAGRYTVAIAHLRSIEEAPLYLKALQVAPEKMKRLKAGQVPIKAVKGILRDALESEKAGAGDDWLADHKYQDKLQPLAHISLKTANSLVPAIYDGDGDLKAVIKFGGGPHSEPILRRLGLILAENAMALLTAVSFCFHEIEAAGNVWDQSGEAVITGGKQNLATAAAEITKMPIRGTIVVGEQE